MWNAVAVEEAWGRNYGAAKLPSYTCAGQEVPMASFSGYKLIGVNAYSEEPEWAAKLARWITCEKNQELRFLLRGQGPSNIKAAASDEVQSAPAIAALLEPPAGRRQFLGPGSQVHRQPPGRQPLRGQPSAAA